jgi:hypothetical protein
VLESFSHRENPPAWRPRWCQACTKTRFPRRKLLSAFACLARPPRPQEGAAAANVHVHVRWRVVQVQGETPRVRAIVPVAATERRPSDPDPGEVAQSSVGFKVLLSNAAFLRQCASSPRCHSLHVCCWHETRIYLPRFVGCDLHDSDSKSFYHTPLPDSMRKLKSLAAVVFPSEGRKQAYGFLRGFTE